LLLTYIFVEDIYLSIYLFIYLCCIHTDPGLKSLEFGPS